MAQHSKATPPDCTCPTAGAHQTTCPLAYPPGSFGRLYAEGLRRWGANR